MDSVESSERPKKFVFEPSQRIPLSLCQPVTTLLSSKVRYKLQNGAGHCASAKSNGERQSSSGKSLQQQNTASVLAVVLHNSLILLNDALPVDDILQQVHVPHACRGSPSGSSTGRRNFESVHHLVPQRCRSSFRWTIRCLFRPCLLHSGVHSRKVSNLSLTSCKKRFPGSFQEKNGGRPCLQSLTRTTFQ